MGLIRVLPEHVVNKIAAGEVIERPASIVKELVENAIDAGAGRVFVEIEEGGVALVRVRDDGSGMSAEDLALAFRSHATSKLHDVEDVFEIATLGFRGEALPSIGSVADVTIRTRERGTSEGWTIRNRGGELSEVAPDGCPEGTRVEVRQLFFRTPARLKFLKTARTESGHVTETMARFALAFPEVGFELRSGGRVSLEAEPGESRLDRIERTLGRPLREAVIPFEVERDGIRLEGYAAPPSLARPDASGQRLFVNGRFVRDRRIAHAIKAAYRDLIPYGGQPVVLLFVDVDPRAIDVNVHPTKSEVRFREAGAVHDLVARAIREAVVGGDLAPRVPAPRASASGPGSAGDVARGERIGAAIEGFLAGATELREPPPAFRRSTSPLVAAGPAGGPAGSGGFLQMHDTFVVVETFDGIEIVDQHALHERVLFDRLKARLAAGPLPSQRLLAPVVVELEGPDAARLSECAGALHRVGLLVEPFGPGAVAIQGVPQATRATDPEQLLRSVTALLAEDESGSDLDRVSDSLCDLIACKAAVKAGDHLPREQIEALLRDARGLEHGHTCPHGRPTTLKVTREQLERYFQRK